MLFNMKKKSNAIFKTNKISMSFWTTILLVLCCKIQLLSCLTKDPINILRQSADTDLNVKQHTSHQVKKSLLTKFQFRHAVYNVTIPENSVGKTFATLVPQQDRMGITISADVDVKYRIISGDREKLFKAEERTVGDFAFLIIRTRTSNVVLNREKCDQYTLNIRAFLSYTHNKNNITNYETDTSVHIEVLDRNDLSPLFYPTEYSITITEDMPIHKSVLKVTAEDADLGINGEIYYSFLYNNDYFAINPTSGVIMLTRQLSYLNHSQFELVVVANDRASIINHYSNKASKAKVSVFIEQVNLHDPEIYVKTLSSIPRNVTTTVYGIVRVNDKDSGRHGKISKLEIVDGDAENNFYIKPTETKGEYFIEINPFSKLLNVPYTHNITLRAEDYGIPKRYAFKTVPVQIYVESRNPPVFTKELYEVSILETAPPNMPIIRLKVTNPDLRKNALVFLEIVGGNEGGEFRINPDSGMLYTQKSLDAEKKSFYTLTVSAIDQANVGVRKQSSAKVKINIEDINDNDPIFQPTNSTIQIDENELAGTFVAKLTAKDRDSGENSYISYSIANLNDVPFDIDHFTGIIKTTTLIDYETMRRKYALIVRASDWGLPYRRQTELELLIEVKDINDNRPQFERINCMGKVLRNTPVGTDIFTLSAIDFDADDYVTYRLISGNEDGCFNLDSTTGVLTIGCDLKDVGIPTRYINVSSTDGTHFSDEMSIAIELVHSGAEGPIESVEMLSGYGTFECRETGVARRLAEILAAAEKNNVDLLNKVAINDVPLTPSRYGQNIHSPEFVDFPQELRINESIELGESITVINARDRDLGYNGKLVYAISDGDYDSVFRIDPDNGELQIIGYLDRERQDEYNLNITVYDLGQPQKVASKMLPITVLDCNDNPPVLQNSLFTFRLSEDALNGTIIYCLNASDADSGDNAKVTYHMRTMINDFYINTSTGCIFTAKTLDRESRSFYELHIIAKDHGMPPLSAEAVVNVIVEDVNDNAPIFGVREFIFRVREDIPRGTVIASVEATDPDIGLNGQIYFSIKHDVMDEELFKIDKITGVIRTQGYLDYETRQVYNLIVSAIDRGTPSLTSEMPVVIEVLDVNENRYAPEFDDFVYAGHIKENQPKGSIVMNITAKDLDTNDPDSMISYSIRGGDGLGMFTVNEQGSIRTAAHLDAETKNYYWLTLCAQDHGIVPLSSCVQVYIQIENENDNVPLTDKPVYYISVPEGSAANTNILRLKAFDNDNDPSQKITYTIISGNPEGYFFINSTTGELTTTERKLDRENQSEHILEISICDNGTPPLLSTTRVVVTVDDINDHSPEFDQRFYKIQVPSTIAAEINASIFQVQAVDNDAGENGHISYYIKSGKGKNRFRMDVESGVIYLSKPLELDTEYEINIRADDNGTPKRSQNARLNIEVVHISERSLHPPIIKTINNKVDVTESDRPGFLVTLIQAVDEDNDQLWYTIIDGNDRNEFYMGRDNGNILLSKALDWERQPSYNLTISVTDGTHDVRTQLYIQVVDTNDNSPQFSQDVYYVNISENIEEESIIMQLHATDKDEDKKIFYTLHAAQDPASLMLFRIDSVTGNVIVTQRLDYEKSRHHILIVTAKDHGTPSKRNYAKIIISIYDHNDHYPEFSSKIVQSKIPESAAIGSKVVQLFALDQDYGKNAEIKYSILTGNVGNMFDIDRSLGIITLAKSLNINNMQEYMLQVKATDLGEPPLSSQIPVHLIVIMADNDPPKYVSPIIVEIYENLAVGSFVSQVDARSSSSVFYEITKGNEEEFFQINPSTGVIYTNDIIDYEKYKIFNLTVTGTNMASSSSNISVIIHILDVNDNAPYFLQKQYFGEISEAAIIGTYIIEKGSHKNSPITLKASDLDVGVNGLIEFTIVDEIAKKFFKIESPTGIIKLTHALDYESIPHFRFKVMAKDMGTPKLYSRAMAEVQIFVQNINDCPPIFKQKELNVTIYTPTYENVIVAQVNATDADNDDNTKIRYDIVDGNTKGCFDIDGLTGIITTRNVEQLGNFHSLRVRASDGLYSTISHVNVHAETADKSGLTFQRAKYEFTTIENSTKISVIGLVNVIGNLLHENVEYKILNPTSMFQIGTTSGAISTTGSMFDRETQDKYQIIVEAKSILFSNRHTYIRRAQVLVDILIQDVNDNCPIFVNLPYYATVCIGDLKGTVVMKVKAVDLDSNENGEVRYEMKKGNGDIFKIDRKTGELSLRQSVEGHNGNFDIVVAAYDGAITPCSTNAVVHIKVVDKSMPIFDKQFYSDVVKEDVDIFSALSVSVQAESPLQRDLIYTISKGNDKELFEVDYRNGVLYVVNELDYETETSHELVVRATDAVSGIFAEVTISINVNDTNDCYPDIELDNYNLTISENLLIGTQILQINATDRDTGANGKLSYFIESINGQKNSSLFYIDITDGSIYLKNILDFEECSFYYLVILVKDHGTPSLTSKANVWITVLDVNDNSPKFVEPSFSSRISVNAKRGQFVAAIKAHDMDFSDKLTYKIIDGNDLQTFSIHENTGFLTLQNMQNFTYNYQALLNVSVSDGVHTSYCRVKIVLVPDNANSPKFVKNIYEGSVSENAEPGVKVINVKANDLDYERFSTLSYDIVSDEMRNFFEIDRMSGSIVTKLTFDREKRMYYDVLVRATDGGGKFAYTSVKIKIEDENDNTPIFNIKEYKVLASMSANENTTLLKIIATDADEYKNGEIKYMINEETIDPSLKNIFSIDELSGNIKISHVPLDFSSKIVQFFVRAIDNGAPQLHSDVPVTIQFIEPDVIVPEFDKSSISLYVLESTPPGTVLTKLKVSGNYSITFSILTDSPKFSITESGEIVLMQTLDRELSDAHSIVAQAETATVPILFISCIISVYVKDENDNYPQFDSSIYSIEVVENIDKVTSLLKITATDKDIGSNSDIRYYLEDDTLSARNVFDIDIYSGWIVLLTTLDRELQSEYYFNVLATDNGQPKHVSKVPVVVKILDTNDNPPLFKQSTYQISVYENALPGTILTYFLITDLDAEKNDVDYFIISGDEHSQFQIGKTGELFVSKALDRETISAYNLKVIVTDGKFSSKTDVQITVKDVNDNVPFCMTPRYKLNINESLAIGTSLMKVVAVDLDENGNELLRYYITGNDSDNFAIEKDTGLLKVAKLIDREIQPKYILYAHVQDGQQLSRECVSEIFISVNDINDNSPEFSMHQYMVSIAEDAAVNTLLTKIHATDKDFGQNRKISYSFYDKQDQFDISSSTGIIKLSKSLDRENVSIFNISVRAEDHGYPKQFAKANVIINVLDINDNPPEFSSKQYFANLPENATLNTEVVTVYATSKDIGVNAEIMYFLIGGNEQKRFAINSKTGSIYVNSELDYEKTKTYFLTVQAIDGGTPPLTNLATVNISILDVNDNLPKFSQNIYRVKVKEDTVKGTKILQVTAFDEDAEQNGVVRYNIERGDRLNQFTINNVNGDVITHDSLDRETIASYLLEVRACDNGVPELCNYVQINVDVLDANDNAPMFTSQNYSIVLQENKNLGHLVLKFDVTDADEHPNAAPYTFDVRSGNEGGFFRIEQDGTLRSAARFNHKVCDSYTLQIRVFDNGTPPLYSDTWVYIRIIEESQYPPVITPLEITIKSYDDDFSGGFLGRVFASDQDKYDTLVYDLAPCMGETYITKNLFNVSRNNGSLYAISNLDIGFYKINVTVSDGKFMASAIVKVNVELVSLEMVKNAAIVRFGKITPEEFILSHRKGFIRSIRTALRCRQKDVVIIALQTDNRKTGEASAVNRTTAVRNVRDTFSSRQRPSFDENLDVVFAVRKQQIIPASEAYFSSEEIRKALTANIEEFEVGNNLIVEEVLAWTCKKNACINGECISRIVLNRTKISTFFTDVISFATPVYSIVNECQCKQGFDGRYCDESVNACSSDPCPPQRHCWPADSPKGYQCACPRGFTGQFCENKSLKCQNSSCANTYTAVSFNGKSYAHYKINKIIARATLEKQFIFSLKIRTMQQSGTILYASGKIDYNVLEISNGAVQYRFDLGSGEGVITVSSLDISDGEWHSVQLERIQNSAKLTVDGKHVSQGSAPGVNGILNIQSNDIFIGAEVRPHPSIIGFEDIQRGFIGCMADIRIALEPLPLYVSGGSSIAALKRFTNVEFTCDSARVLVFLGICGTQPCLNGGICTDLGENNFKCTCHARFTGAVCEIDLDPCASSPCLFGGRCEHHSPGNYTCICPMHLSGRRCEYGKFCSPNPCKNGGICEEGDGIPHCMCRGYTGPTCEIDVNECDNQPCGNGATCINEAGSFRCICPSYLTGASCGDPLYSNSISTKLRNLSLEEMTGIISGIIIVFLVIIIILCNIIIKRKCCSAEKRPRNRKGNFKDANLNSLIDKERYNKHNVKISNLEVNQRPLSYAQSTNDNLFPSNTTFVNNLDILRSYGSAGDELESIPFEYQKINLTNPQVNVNSYNCNEVDGVNKQDWCEEMHLKTFSENKLNYEKKLDYGLPMNRLAYSKPSTGKLIQVPMPNLCHSRNVGGGECSSSNHGEYHWDCSDWVRKSHNPLPDITEVPGAEIADSSSFHSNDSNESKPQSAYIVKGNGVDPSRDITTLNEDLTSEYIDSEMEACIKPLQMPLISCNSLSRLSPIDNIDNIEDYKLNTGKVYLCHPDSYLPLLKTPSDTEGDIGTELFSCPNTQSSSRRKITDNSENVYVFGNNHMKKSNSNLSVHLCEIEDSELEDYFPTERRKEN